MKSSRILGAAFTVHSSFSELMHQYDGFILDQFGVLHNGKHPLPGAVACVQELIRRKKKLVILSNTSSPSKSALSKIQKIGFEPEWFEGGAVTSGEEASSYISETYGKTRDGHQKKAIWFTYTSDKTPPPLDFLEACGDIQLADTVEQADFIIAHGSEIWLKRDQKEMKLGSFMSDGNLQCKTRNLPLICANPDFVVKVADGSTAFMPGTIAQHYEKLGGSFTFFGKPQVAHFEACLRKLKIDRERVAHVGDSLHHDVAGANNSGINCVFVTGGIHLNDLDADFGSLPSTESLHALFDKHQIRPTHVIPSFITHP